MRAKKKLSIVAFDISSAKSRRKVVAKLMKYGKRINKSVFECIMTDGQIKEVREYLRKFSAKGDCIVIIPLCLDCYSKMEMICSNKCDPVEIVRLLE